jgi:hypothetical protein
MEFCTLVKSGWSGRLTELGLAEYLNQHTVPKNQAKSTMADHLRPALLLCGCGAVFFFLVLPLSQRHNFLFLLLLVDK